MKAAYLISEYPAPSHTFIRREVAALRRRGVEIHTFSVRRPRSGEWMGPDDRAEEAATHYLLPATVLGLLRAHASCAVRRPRRYLRTLCAALCHRPPGVRAVLYAFFYFAEAMLLAYEMRRRGIDHLHNHFANSGAIVGFLATHFTGMPWSLTLHGISEFDYPAGLLLGAKIQASRFAACVSHFGRAQAQRLLPPSEWPKLFINRCGVDVGRLPAVDRRPEAGRLRVLAVGRMSAEKAFPGLVEAFAAVRSRGIDATLDIIGEGTDRPHTEHRIRELHLEDVCNLRGCRSESEVLQAMGSADLFAMSSLAEGLPVVLMEALALELPVVAPRIAGIPELVRDGTTGLLYAAGNWGELADCMIRLLEDRELRRQLAREGRLRVLQEFDIDRAVEPILARLHGRLDAERGKTPPSPRAILVPSQPSAVPPRRVSHSDDRP